MTLGAFSHFHLNMVQTCLNIIFLKGPHDLIPPYIEIVLRHAHVKMASFFPQTSLFQEGFATDTSISVTIT